MLCVWSDFLSAADTRHVTLLGLLDLSVVFDCVNHDLLLQRLELSFDLMGTVLQWLQSFLTNQSQQVAYDGQTPVSSSSSPFSSTARIRAGPLLYVLYTAELGHVVAHHRIQLHQYADDSQVYTSVAVSSTTAAIQTFTACISDISAWMSASRL